MMRLAFGGKCGAGRMPLNGFSGSTAAAANASRLSKVKSAAPPRPKANRPKNSRRFMAKLMLLQFIKNQTTDLDETTLILFELSGRIVLIQLVWISAD